MLSVEDLVYSAEQLMTNWTEQRCAGLCLCMCGCLSVCLSVYVSVYLVFFYCLERAKHAHRSHAAADAPDAPQEANDMEFDRTFLRDLVLLRNNFTSDVIEAQRWFVLCAVSLFLSHMQVVTTFSTALALRTQRPLLTG